MANSSSATGMGSAPITLRLRDGVGPFSVFLFHNGIINRVGEVKYLGGDVQVYAKMEANEVCLTVLKDKMKQLGYCEIGTLIYCYWNGSLKLLQSDNDVISILNEVNPDNMLELWVETMDELNLIDAEIEVVESDGDWESEVEVDCVGLDKQVGVVVGDDLIADQKRDPKVEKEGETMTKNMEDEINFSDEDSIVDSDSDGEVKWPVFRAATDMQDPHFTLGMTFASKQQFREAVRNYAFNNGKKIRTVKNDKVRVIVQCTQEGCPWRIGLRKVINSLSWRILKMIDEHAGCSLVLENSAKVGRPKMLRKKFAGELSQDGISVSRKHIQLHCSLCRQAGHNLRKCPSNPNQDLKPKKRIIYATKQIPICMPSHATRQQQGDQSGQGQQQQVDQNENGLQEGDQYQLGQQQGNQNDQGQQQQGKSMSKTTKKTTMRQSNRKKPYYTRSKTTMKSKFFGNKDAPINIE
ncbi:PREDICTED: uncharacterized protein LOC109177307 isoform X2 [Ipomoea nil]|uniref:uncharacterized protein LOC109177307 isoform X2 n=1 Tax=Ipomoea nil TaxID=35883 RepID=UPI0009011345|nr:PREDICTED: uncharacterized protein LOC109177307 isoform X2 [Ipomoea nil]